MLENMLAAAELSNNKHKIHKDVLPLVSIITPTFNSEKWIRNCIECIKKQSYSNIEHIVIDGVSTDKTLEICAEYPDIQVLSEPDRGQSDAINKGFSMAQGQILAWLCADDRYELNAVELAVENILRGSPVVMGNSVFVDADNKLIRVHPSGFVGNYTHSKLLKFWKYIPVSQPAIFWSRECWEYAGPLKENLHFAMDYDLWLRISKRYDLHHFNQQIARYTIHPEAKCFSDNYGSRIELIKVSQSYWPNWYNPGYWFLFLSYHLSPGSITQHYADAEYYISCAASKLISNEYSAAVINLIKAVRIHPASIFMRIFRQAGFNLCKQYLYDLNKNNNSITKKIEKNVEYISSINSTIEISNKKKSKKKYKPLRIALFCKNSETRGSGNEKLVFKTARTLIARGHDVRVYLINPRFDTDNPPDFVYQWPKLPLEKYFEFALRCITGLNDMWFPSTILLRLSPWLAKSDIWHFHNLHPHYVSLPILTSLSRSKNIILSPVDEYMTTGHCPYSMSCNGYETGCNPCLRPKEKYPGMIRDTARLMWSIRRNVFKNGNFNIFFHTQSLASQFQKRCALENIKVIPYGEDIYCYRPMSKTRCANKLGVNISNKFSIGLFHGRIDDPRKGIIEIIRRLNKMPKEMICRFELIVVGRGSDEISRYTHSAISITALPFYKNEQDLSCALNLCDVLLYPTLAENLSLSTLAALSCGIPVITYDSGGQSEAVINGINGYVVPCGDSDRMIQCLGKIINDSELQNSLSMNARKYIENNFNFDEYVFNLENYYKESLSTHRLH